MTGLILRTKFEYYFSYVFIFALTNTFVFLFLQLDVEGLAKVVFLGFMAIILYAILGISVRIKDGREKRIRLYSQLPVTHNQIRLAYWCFTAICLAIPSILLVIVMLDMGDIPFSKLILYTLLFYFHAGLYAALATIAFDHLNIKKVIRGWYLIFIGPPSLLLILFLLNILTYGYAVLFDQAETTWMLISIFQMCLCLALIFWDIKLFNRSENYLA